MMGERAYQRDFFDVSPRVAKKIDEDSVYALIHHLGPRLLRDEDYAEMYDLGDGRPSHPPSLLAGILLLQRHEDVSDREAIGRLQFDLRWQYALRLPVDYSGMPHSNLSHFRARLIVHELEGWAFDRFLELAEETGALDLDEAQAIDSSHIFGAAAVQDTYELLQSGLRGLLETLHEEAPEAASRLIGTHELEGRLSTEKPDIDWSDEEERLEWLQAVVKDARALLSALDGHPLASSEAVQEAAELLKQILAQDITEPGGDASSEGPRIRQGVATDRVVSTVDPEMRHGRKSSSKRFDGYKVHITEALESELITGVTVTPGNAHDGSAAGELTEQVRRRLGEPPQVLIGDSHYGSPELREKLEAEGTEVVAKLPPASSRSDLPKSEFEIDLEEERVTCPAGETTSHSTQRRDHKGRPVPCYRFAAEACNSCELKTACTSSDRGRTITLNYHEERLQKIRAYAETEEFDKRYRRRSLVERKFSELLWRHGLRFGRYVGRKKTELQAVLTATVVNLKRAGKEVLETLTEQTLQPAPAG